VAERRILYALTKRISTNRLSRSQLSIDQEGDKLWDGVPLFQWCVVIGRADAQSVSSAFLFCWDGLLCSAHSVEGRTAATHYATALRLLGAAQYPHETYSDQVLP